MPQFQQLIIVRRHPLITVQGAHGHPDVCLFDGPPPRGALPLHNPLLLRLERVQVIEGALQLSVSITYVYVWTRHIGSSICMQ